MPCPDPAAANSPTWLLASIPPPRNTQMMALLQKRIISRCNQMGKPVLMTRFVDTMVDTPRPTRAGAIWFGVWVWGVGCDGGAVKSGCC